MKPTTKEVRMIARQTALRISDFALPAAVIATAIAAVLATAGCTPSLPPNPPGITGAITSIVAGDGRPASFVLEGSQPRSQGAVADKAMVNIPTSTQFFDAKGGRAALTQIGAIKQGSRVRVWFEGAVAESYPVQGSAKAVQILAP
jgi:hypothetical protein